MLYAAREGALPAKHRQQLLEAIERRLSQDGDLELVKRLVNEGGGVKSSKAFWSRKAKENRWAQALARRFVDLASIELDKRLGIAYA